MVERDRQVVVVETPELLEGVLGLEAGVDEDERGPGVLDRLVYLRHRMLGRVPGPGHVTLRQEDVHHWRRARRAAHEVDIASARRRQPATDHVRIVDGGREADAAQLRRELLQPRKAEREEIAALGGPDRMHLVDDHAAQVLEVAPRALPGAEQGQLLGRGQQHVGRLHPLALAAREPGVPRARLGPDR